LKDYNNVKENPDIEQGTIFRFGKYVCEVDDFNYDAPNESIVFIYKSYKDYKNGNYLEQVSLLNKDIKQNIEEYMEENYNVNSIDKMSLLIEMKDQISSNLLSYSSNYTLSEPMPGCEREWKKSYQKLALIQQMIKEEREKNKDYMER